jgi:hypothetical protein
MGRILRCVPHFEVGENPGGISSGDPLPASAGMLAEFRPSGRRLGFGDTSTRHTQIQEKT